MYITQAAIRYNGDEVLTAYRHYKIMHLQAKLGIKTEFGHNAEDGFVTDTGQFVTRAEAKKIAIKSGQIPADFKGTLYSEDLWPDSIAEQAD